MVRFFDSAFIEKAGALILVGASGLGKTHLAVALGTKMVQLGYQVRFLTAQQFANSILAAGSRAAVERAAAALAALRPAHPRRIRLPERRPQVGPAMYELVAGRYERRATVITSNKSLATWGELVGRQRLDDGDHRPPAPPRRGVLSPGSSFRMRGKEPLVLGAGRGAGPQHQWRDAGDGHGRWVTFARKGAVNRGQKWEPTSHGFWTGSVRSGHAGGAIAWIQRPG